VYFSFFRYPAGHTPIAFMLMGFQGLFLGRGMPPGTIRLMGCGSRDGFSIIPDLRTYCLMSALEDPADMARLRRTRLYRWVASPSIEQLHFELSPSTGHGTWDGDEVFAYSGHRAGARPFAVLTHARVGRGSMRRFWRSVPAIREDLKHAGGCLYHIGFGEHPLRTLATFSIWNDLPSMQQFAYRHTAHHDVSVAARKEHWLAESMFVRFDIERISGDVERYPALEGLAIAA
jgi:spheroidene monooxygenase